MLQRLKWPVAAGVGVAALAWIAWGDSGVKAIRHSGAMDGSALALVEPTGEFVSACDEDNVLRWYRAGQSGAPLRLLNLNAFLGSKAESDIEGAARISDRIYWIASHGTNKKGETSPSRRVLFAVDTDDAQPVGRPYGELLEDMAADGRFAKFGLEKAAIVPPKEPGGLSIEGLAATPSGALLVGFRNPVPQGRALVVTLENPGEVVEGGKARFGAAFQLDLGGFGIRGLERGRDGYWIIAGPINGSGESCLYRWSGDAQDRPEIVPSVSFKGLNPESLAFRDDPERGPELLVISDDGADQKKKKKKNQTGFRSVWFAL